MKKVTAIFISLLCILSLHLAFAGSAQPTYTQSPKQPIAERPRFQR
jgi:preprotein translocase subunit SecG